MAWSSTGRARSKRMWYAGSANGMPKFSHSFTAACISAVCLSMLPAM
jgi:hypothetical protein